MAGMFPAEAPQRAPNTAGRATQCPANSHSLHLGGLQQSTHCRADKHTHVTSQGMDGIFCADLVGRLAWKSQSFPEAGSGFVSCYIAALAARVCVCVCV